MARRRQRWWSSDDDLDDDLILIDGSMPAPRKKLRPPVLRHDDAAVFEILERGEILDCKPIPWGSNYSFFVMLGRRGEPECLAVYKPRRGEVPLWDFPDGTLYLRERAAYVVAIALGLDFIPPTVIRDGPHGVGTVQLFVEPDEAAEFHHFRIGHIEELRAIALFDIIANNADRKSGHCFKGTDGRIWGIDHGLTFNVVPKLRTVIWDFCGQSLPAGLGDHLLELCTDAARAETLRCALGELLHPSEVAAFFARLERVVERGEFPTLDPYRNVPRGFF